MKETQMISSPELSVTQLPVKTPVYGTLVGLMNVKNFDFGKEVVHRLGAELEVALQKADTKSIKLLLRFLAELANANVVLPSALLSIFDQMLVSVGENKGDEVILGQRRSDFFVYAILSTLPYAGRELADRNPEELDRVLDTIEAYLSKRSSAVNAVVAVYDTEEVRICGIFCVLRGGEGRRTY